MKILLKLFRLILAILLSPVLLVVAGIFVLIGQVCRFVVLICTDATGILIAPYAPDMDQ